MFYLTLFLGVGFACIAYSLLKKKAVPVGLHARPDLFRRRVYRTAGMLLLVLTAIALLLVKGTRYGIGIDYFYTYVPRFTEVLLGKTPGWGDWLYTELMKLVSMFSPDFRLLFLVDATLMMVLLFCSFSMASSNPMLSFLLLCVTYHYLRSFIFQAQYLAIAVVMFSFSLSFLFDRKWIAALGIILASGFHSSALVMIPSFLIASLSLRIKKENRRWVIWVSIIIPTATLMVRPLIPMVAGVLLSGTRYYKYFGTSFADSAPSWRQIIVNAAVFLFMIAIYWRGGMKNEGKARFYLLIQSFALACSFLTGAVPLMYRICLYPMMFQTISIPFYVRSVDSNRVRLSLTVALTLAFAGVQFFYIAPSDGDGVFPYVSIFDERSLPAPLNDLENKALGDYFWAIDALDLPDDGLEQIRMRMAD